MTKTLIALTAGLFLATGASAFAKSTALDVQGQPARASSVDYTPTAAIGTDRTFTTEGSAMNGFGDYSPAHQGASASGVDYTPTAAIGNDSALNDEGSAENGFGDYSPAPQVLWN